MGAPGVGQCETNRHRLTAPYVTPNWLTRIPCCSLCLHSFQSSGKGTFATRLAPILGIPTISTGDLIRAEIKAGTPVGKQVKALTEKGGLVGDDIVLGLLKNRLQQPDVLSKGFMLDGYPRRVSQAETLSQLHPISLALNFTLDENILVEKALARRVCDSCGTGYNLANIQRDGYEMPPLLPKVEGKCDKCSGKLVTRVDDTEKIIRDRLEIYNKETFPIIEFYRKQGKLMEFKVKKGVADLPDLVKQLEQRLNLKK